MSREFTPRTLNRRAMLFGAASTALLARFASARTTDEASHFRNAMSLSPFAEYVLGAGIAFTDGTRTARTSSELQSLFMAHGANELYVRISTRRTFLRELGDHGVERGIERARLAKSLGIPLNPELGLFGWYGDVSHQPPPDFADYPALKPTKPWHELKLDEMAAIFESYGALIAEEIVATGVTVNFWDVGNEIEYGTAGVGVRPLVTEQFGGWKYQAPDAVDPEIGRMEFRRLLAMPEEARVEWLSKHLWPAVGTLLAAVTEGIRTVDKSARFSTHMSGVSAYSPRTVIAFYETLDRAGFHAVEAGVSYYPSSSDKPERRFDLFKDMVTQSRTALKRQVFVAEYAYPTGPFKYGKDNWDHPVAPYAVSVSGQADLLRDIAAWGAGSGHLSGIRPWAPEITAPEWAAMCFFELQGTTAKARPSLDSIAAGVAFATTTKG